MFETLSIDNALAKLTSSTEGLSFEEVQRRHEQYGFNELPEKKRSLLLMFLHQFHDVLIYILFGALALSIALPFFEGHAISWTSFIDAYVIASILLLNALLGFAQEFQAERAIAELAKLSSPHARVRRNGNEVLIESRDLIPGDILILEAGDKIPADGRMLAESHFRTEESSLTGESKAVSKDTEALETEKGISGRVNCVFSGTVATRGSAEVLVTATGVKTEIGKIAKLVSETHFPTTPLQTRMQSLGKLIGTVVIALCALVIAIGIFEGMPLIEIILIGISLAVSAVPEGLPAVVTVCLAMGVRRMVGQNAIVRRLESLETLGSVTVICTDKTGTITENKMKVIETWVCQGADETLLTTVMASCNRAKLPNLGDPTEIGLLEYAAKQGISREGIDEEEVPFTSEEKYMQTKHGEVSYLKGAPEKIISLCDAVNADEVLKKNEEFALRGLRVLAGAIRENGNTRFVGLMAMEDPARPGVEKAIREAATAGIRTIMITGDNIITASSIAGQVGIHGEAMLGKELESLSPEELAEKLKTTSVFARVSPEHKLRILQSLMLSGHIVSMSGDGVNDAPALKGAHVGLSMGKDGTEVAREASSIVLADDQYATIVAAIHEGRRIYDNIKKFVLFLLRANFDELLFIMTTLLIGLPLPYLPVHILWINLMTDSLPALALGMEDAEADIMKRPPRPTHEHIFHGEWGKLVALGLFGFLASFLFYWWQLSNGVEVQVARTASITMAVFMELLLALSTRSRRPLWEIGLLTNKWMIWAIGIPIAIHLLTLFTPLAILFEFTSISLTAWVQIAGILIISIAFFEGSKLVRLSRSP